MTTAEVTLALSTDCGTNMVAPTPTPISHRFYIDMRPRCRLPEAPTAETSPGRRRINWQKAANVDRYEVLGYAAFDGRLLFSDETRDLWFAVPDHASGLLVIVVRPRCGTIDGAPAYLLN